VTKRKRQGKLHNPSCSTGPLALRDSISSLGLVPRVQQVLRGAGVCTVKQLVEVDLGSIFELRWVDGYYRRQLESTQTRLKAELLAGTKAAERAGGHAGKATRNGDAAKEHAYKKAELPGDSVSSLGLGGRTEDILGAVGVHTVGELATLDLEVIERMCWVSRRYKKRIKSAQSQVKARLRARGLTTDHAKGHPRAESVPLEGRIGSLGSGPRVGEISRDIGVHAIKQSAKPELGATHQKREVGGRHKRRMRATQSQASQSASKLETKLSTCGVAIGDIDQTSHRNGIAEEHSQTEPGRRLRDPWLFPVRLDAYWSTGQATPNAASVLNLTLPALYGLTVEETDTLWESVDGKVMGEMLLSQDVWDSLGHSWIFQDDPLETLLSTSLGRLVDGIENEEQFNSIRQEFVMLVLGALEGNRGLPILDSFSREPILGDIAEKVRKIHLGAFALPRGLMHVLGQEGMYFTTEIASQSEQDIIQKHGLGFKALRLIKSLWSMRPWMECIKEVDATTVDQLRCYHDLDKILVDALERLMRRKRVLRRTIMLAVEYLMKAPPRRGRRAAPRSRFRGDDVTYDSLAKTLGVTRSRVGQMVKRVLDRFSSPALRADMALFWIAVYSIISAEQGMVSLDRLVVLLREELGWKKSPSSTMIEELVKANPSLEYDRRTRSVYFRGWECAKCERIRIRMAELAKSRSTTTPEPLNESLNLVCDNCGSTGKIVIRPNIGSVARLLFASDGERIHIEEGMVYLREHWDLKTGKVTAPIDQLMLLLTQELSRLDG
jgi:hypothetical protein